MTKPYSACPVGKRIYDSTPKKSGKGIETEVESSFTYQEEVLNCCQEETDE